VRPSVLIVTASRWFPTARLAAALARAGCQVNAVCPSRHPMAKLAGVRKTYPYRSLMALASLREAIRATKPDLVVPGDDLATRHLHRLHASEMRRGTARHPICDLIERSLGSRDSFPLVYARTASMELARGAGIRSPRTEVIASLTDLKRWAKSTGFPTVLKANGTSGGEGVRVVHNLEEAEAAFRTLQAPPLLLRAFKRAVVNQDKTLLWPSLLRHRSVVNAQEFVPGREGTSAVACWKGAVLASLHFEVIHKRDHAGPSSVVRLIENAEMSAAAEVMVRELDLSGLHGFDYMLENDTGNAYLIEINPRATQVGHLTLGPGRDLPAALYAALSGEPVKTSPTVTENDTIALFPQEWTRDPASPFLQSAYHDVPWDEPGLLGNFAGKRPQEDTPALISAEIRTLSAARLPRL
jgi:hypothetical protein